VVLGYQAGFRIKGYLLNCSLIRSPAGLKKINRAFFFIKFCQFAAREVRRIDEIADLFQYVVAVCGDQDIYSGIDKANQHIRNIPLRSRM